jgi:hypothetical protein
MKEFSKIPVTKVERATKFITTGAKIGKNYLKHYSKKLVDPNMSRVSYLDGVPRDSYWGQPISYYSAWGSSYQF